MEHRPGVLGKWVFSTFLILWLFGNAFAQTDSLRRVWTDASKPDSARLKAIQILAWKAVFEQPDSGMALANEQLKLAERINDGKAIYEALTTLAVGTSMKSDYATSLSYLHRCLTTAQRMEDRKRQANTYSNLSNVYKNLGDLPLALEQLEKSLRIDMDLGNKEGLAGTYNNIGNIHTELGDLELALQNYQRSGALAEELDNTRSRAQALLNLGATHLELGALDTALSEFEKSMVLYRTMGRKLELGMAFNNLGRVYGKLQSPRMAFASLDSAEIILSALGSMRQLARTYINRGNLHLELGDPRSAIAACSKGLELATHHELLQQQRECQLCLSIAFEAAGDFRRSLYAQRAYQGANDSLLALNDSREVARMEVTRVYQERMLADSLSNAQERFDRDLAHQEQLGNERDRRNMFLFSSIGVLLFAVGLWTRLRYMRRSRAAISKEKDRSDELLHNILPIEVASELKAKGHADAKYFEQATILFTDFKGFTGVSEQLTPEDLVHELNICFKEFDRIVSKHGIEKIKTIGDAYMCAGGLPDPLNASATDVVFAALEMQTFMKTRKAEREAQGKPGFEMRVGIHTGPVVAGIVGMKKFQYDIWGDAVNIASRMESSGAVGEVNISEATYRLVQEADVDRPLSIIGGATQVDPNHAESRGKVWEGNKEAGLLFDFSPRGKVQAKGKGEMEMFFVRLRG